MYLFGAIIMWEGEIVSLKIMNKVVEEDLG